MADPNGYGSTQPSGTGSKKLQQTHAQVNEVVDIMRENVEKVIDRDIKLSELDDRADALQQGASQFETQAAKLKRKFWWKNMKMWLIIGAIVLIVAIIIVFSYKNDEAAATGLQVPPAVQAAPIQQVQPVAAEQKPVPATDTESPATGGETETQGPQ